MKLRQALEQLCPGVSKGNWPSWAKPYEERNIMQDERDELNTKAEQSETVLLRERCRVLEHKMGCVSLQLRLYADQERSPAEVLSQIARILVDDITQLQQQNTGGNQRQ